MAVHNLSDLWRALRRRTRTEWPPVSSTKDVKGFGSSTLRWSWQFYTWRMTQAGRWFFWASVAFTAYAMPALAYQSYVPFCYVTGLWALALIAAYALRPKVKLRVLHDDRVCAGHVLPVEISVQVPERWRRLDLSVQPHRLPADIDAPNDEGVRVPAVQASGRKRMVLPLLCRRRGSHRLNGYRVETDFPFGLLRAYCIVDLPRTVLVYPAYKPLTHLELPAGRRYQPGGVALASLLGDSVEFIGNREYREGDNIRDIDWRATARLNTPIVREYREEYFLRVAVILDTHVPADGTCGRAECFERAVSLAAAAGEYLARQEYIVDIFAAGPHLYHLTAGRSLACFDQILDILACVDSSPDEPFETIAPELMENLSQISAVVCVFLDWNEARRLFVQRLQSYGAGLKVVVVSDVLKRAEEHRVVSSKDVDAGAGEL